MNNANGTVTLASVADPCRPLALTPRENLKGYLGTHLGRGLLFFVTFSSVLAVLLILVFVVLRSGDFFSTSSIVAFIAGRSWRPTAEEPAFGALAIIVGSLYVSLAVLTLPVMIRASEEAIRAVPQSYKEGSMALGASRFHTFVTVILPAALPGILTGVILSLSRIAGETAPILFTGAVSLGAIPHSIFDPTRTLSYGSYDMAVGDRLAMMVPHNQYGMVVTLIMLILVLNGVTIVLRGRVFKKLRGH